MVETLLVLVCVLVGVVVYLVRELTKRSDVSQREKDLCDTFDARIAWRDDQHEKQLDAAWQRCLSRTLPDLLQHRLLKVRAEQNHEEKIAAIERQPDAVEPMPEPVVPIATGNEF